MEFQLDNEIKLRSFIESDAKEVFSAVKANYEHLRPFLHWVVPEYSLESAQEFIEQTRKNSTEKTGETLGIFYQGKFAGIVGFFSFDWNSRKMEIGYWIAKDFSGRGIITKACKTIINYAFDELEMNRIEIRCVTENIRSKAIPERLGFKLEGVLRQSMWRHTRVYDLAIYGLLKEDWKINS